MFGMVAIQKDIMLGVLITASKCVFYVWAITDLLKLLGVLVAFTLAKWEK